MRSRVDSPRRGLRKLRSHQPRRTRLADGRLTAKRTGLRGPQCVCSSRGGRCSGMFASDPLCGSPSAADSCRAIAPPRCHALRECATRVARRGVAEGPLGPLVRAAAQPLLGVLGPGRPRIQSAWAGDKCAESDIVGGPLSISGAVMDRPPRASAQAIEQANRWTWRTCSQRGPRSFAQRSNVLRQSCSLVAERIFTWLGPLLDFVLYCFSDGPIVHDYSHLGPGQKGSKVLREESRLLPEHLLNGLVILSVPFSGEAPRVTLFKNIAHGQFVEHPSGP